MKKIFSINNLGVFIIVIFFIYIFIISSAGNTFYGDDANIYNFKYNNSIATYITDIANVHMGGNCVYIYQNIMF